MASKQKKRGREENEVEFARIVAFSDGVFAIAITLLVLNLDVPRNLSAGDVPSALWDLRDSFFAFAISFAVIGRFWIVHHRFFGEVKAFDARLLVLNLAYLFWIVVIPFSSQVLGEYGGQTASVVLYSVDLIGVVAVGIWMTGYARGAGLADTDPLERRISTFRALFIASVFLVSIPVAFVDPEIAPLIWLALFFDPAQRLVARGVSGER